MMNAAEINEAHISEDHELVRQFSFEVAPTVAYPDVIHAVADYGKQERACEAAKWRPHFQDDGTASSLELRKLGVEFKELEKILKAFPEAGNVSKWGYVDAQAAVTEAKKAYETKKRAFSGKPQKVYHDVMCNLDAHSGLLRIIPDGNTYVSVVAGAVKTLVKASVNHRRSIEDLTAALKDVNDEAQACVADSDLVQSEATQVAIAKFYIATFLFYGDAIKWFQSSSAKKVWHSLDDNFSERFKRPLAEIKRLSGLVQRAASSGSGAEVRVTRLAIEDATEDVRVGLQGLARDNAELRQMHAQMLTEQEKTTAAMNRFHEPGMIKTILTELWHSAGFGGTALLIGQKRNMREDLSIDEVASDSRFRMTAGAESDQEHKWEQESDELKINDVSCLLERLLRIISRGVRVVDVGCTPNVTFDQRITTSLEQWTLGNVSTLLYLEAESECALAHLPQVTVAAARIVDGAEQVRVPTISFFCDVEPTNDFQYQASNDEMATPLLGLVYSLTFQLTNLLPPLMCVGSLMTSSEAASLKASSSSWHSALRMLSSLLTVAPPFLICVIDGFHAFESPDLDPAATRELLSVFQKAIEVEHKIFKVLFTSSRRAFTLIREVPWERSEIIQGFRTGGIGSVPAGRAFLDFEMDTMMRNGMD